MPFAHCTPNSVWATATSAGVRALDGSFSDRVLPVEHRSTGNHTIQKASYPNGIIVIPTGSDPSSIPAVLPVIVSTGSSQSITLEPSNLLDYGVGGGVVFV